MDKNNYLSLILIEIGFPVFKKNGTLSINKHQLENHGPQFVKTKKNFL